MGGRWCRNAPWLGESHASNSWIVAGGIACTGVTRIARKIEPRAEESGGERERKKRKREREERIVAMRSYATTRPLPASSRLDRYLYIAACAFSVYTAKVYIYIQRRGGKGEDGKKVKLWVRKQAKKRIRRSGIEDQRSSSSSSLSRALYIQCFLKISSLLLDRIREGWDGRSAFRFTNDSFNTSVAYRYFQSDLISSATRGGSSTRYSRGYTYIHTEIYRYYRAMSVHEKYTHTHIYIYK